MSTSYLSCDTPDASTYFHFLISIFFCFFLLLFVWDTKSIYFKKPFHRHHFLWRMSVNFRISHFFSPFFPVVASTERLVWHRWCVQTFQLFQTKNFLIGHGGKVGHHSGTGLRENLGWEPASQRVASLQHIRTSIACVCLLLQCCQSIQSLSLTCHPDNKQLLS